MDRPDFLCIGAQKSGTTWLYVNLTKHKQVWTPPIKEFHYFNRVCMNDQLLGNWGLPIPKANTMYWQAAKKLNYSELRWLRRYYNLGLEKKWYQSLFTEAFKQGRKCGDLTPGYSTLSERGVKYAAEVVGTDTPIIFIIRNPIERAWSATKMLCRYHGIEVSAANTDKILSILNSPNVTLCSEYSRIIPLWQQHFKQLHILTYDELCHSPNDFLTKISNIIGIDDQWDENTIKKMVWGDTKKLQLPDQLLAHLVKQYSHELTNTYAITQDDDVAKWLDYLPSNLKANT